jgi:hypothetical protein
MARLLDGDMSPPRGRPMMTVRCSEASAAPHHGAARDTAGRDRPIPKRIGQTFSTPARRGSAMSSKTSARRRSCTFMTSVTVGEHTIKIEQLADPKLGEIYPRLLEVTGRRPPEGSGWTEDANPVVRATRRR